MRIGAVNYLNSKPLVYRLADRAPHARLLFDLPSRLADSLAAGRLDVALVPCFEFLSDPSYVMASDACVASRGPVRSVKLYFRTQPADVRKLALDEGSRTSAALSHVLLHRRHGLRPEISRLPIGSGVEAADADAVLLIGDRAMTPPREPFVAAWDLGEEWLRWARLPFVFACWATPSRAVAEEIAPVLAASRDEGEGLLSEIAAVEGPKLDLQAGDAYGYLTQNLHYRIGADERRSIALYRSECERIGLLPTGSAERPGGWPGMNAADLMNAGPGRTRPGRLTPSDWERPSRPFFDEQAPMSIASQAVRPTRKPAAPRTPREPIQPLLDKAVGGERLSPAEWTAPRTGFFPSIEATMRHLHAIELFYLDAIEEGGLGRAVRDPPPFPSAAALRAPQQVAGRRFIAAAETRDPARIVPVAREDRMTHESIGDLILHLAQHQVQVQMA
ncbi:MAG: MqnA/MqnD/SBP family protein [Planctomycetota bacterium]